MTRPQDRHASQASQAGFSDLHTYQYLPARAGANKFLIVQCKRRGLETRDSTWVEGVRQLEQYLSATHRTRRVNQTPVYGIVAVGMYMRVYEYNDATNSVVNLRRPGVPRTDEPLHLRENRIAIQQILDHIKADH